MAIVSRFSVEKVALSSLLLFTGLTQIQQAASVKQAVKRGLTQRLRERVGMGDTDSDTESSDDEKTLANLRKKRRGRRSFIRGNKNKDLETGADDDTDRANSFEKQSDLEPAVGGSNEKINDAAANVDSKAGEKDKKNEESKKSKFQLPKVAAGMASMSMLEQSMPADAVLAKEGAAEVRFYFLKISRLR